MPRFTAATVVPHAGDLIVPGSLGAHALAWLAQLAGAGRVAETLRCRKRSLRMLFAILPPHTRAREVTGAHLSAWLVALRASPRADGRPRTANGILQIEDNIRSFWRWMERQELIDANPWTRLPRGRGELVVLNPPTGEQVQALVNGALSPRSVPGWVRLRDAAIVATLYDTGLRRAEMAALTRADLDAGTFTITGKGGVQRAVHLSEPVRAAVRAYLAAYEAACGPLGPDAPLWQGRWGAPMAGGTLYQAVRGAGRRSGQVARPHLLRHAFATDFVERTNDVVTAAVLLGHQGQDLRMTRRYTRTVEQRRALRQHTAHSPALGLMLPG